MRSLSKIALATGLLATAALGGSAAPALANGCNGYVNQAVWGCAFWDHNNGPQFPHYNKPAPAPVRNVPAPVAPNKLIGNAGGAIITHDGGSIVSHDSGTLIGNAGGAMRH